MSIVNTAPLNYENILNNKCLTQNDLLLNNLINFYKNDEYIEKLLKIITGESKISLRILDWFSTNYAKKNYTLYNIEKPDGSTKRFKVYNDYKLKLKSYSTKRFDPFCRWERTVIPYKNDTFIETTIGQLNFFKWAIENNIIEYVEEHYALIENDMNKNNSTSKNKNKLITNSVKTRKKREELSISAVKSIKKESIEIVVSFN